MSASEHRKTGVAIFPVYRSVLLLSLYRSAKYSRVLRGLILDILDCEVGPFVRES